MCRAGLLVFAGLAMVVGACGSRFVIRPAVTIPTLAQLSEFPRASAISARASDAPNGKLARASDEGPSHSLTRQTARVHVEGDFECTPINGTGDISFSAQAVDFDRAGMRRPSTDGLNGSSAPDRVERAEKGMRV